ncbi:hypothetical protein ABZP36_027453 [Zizania latifolia]
MAQPGRRQRQRRQRGRGLLALLLLFLSLFARVDAAASAAAANPGWKEGEVAIAVEEAVRQQAAAAEGGRPERVEMEVINDYPNIGPNKRHNPHP